MEDEGVLSEKELIAAKVSSILGESRNIPVREARNDFLTYIASSTEIDPKVFGEKWGFLNKDIPTSRLNHYNALAVVCLAKAVSLAKLKKIPPAFIKRDDLEAYYNFINAVYVRAMKSVGGFLVRQISESTEVRVLSTKKD